MNTTQLAQLPYTIIAQGAESIISVNSEHNIIKKERPPKNYRISQIDTKLTKQRTKAEIKILHKLQKAGVAAPRLIADSDSTIYMQYINAPQLKEVLTQQNYTQFATAIARILTQLHNENIIHGDLTTSNILCTDTQNATIALIDFGLSKTSLKLEEKAVDLHLLRQALESYHSIFATDMFELLVQHYKPHNKDAILERLAQVEKRGKNKH